VAGRSRTAVGFNDVGVLLVTTLQGGRRPGLTMADLAAALRALGCREALNLDGGPSSALYGAGRLLNVAPGFEDVINPVASALLVEVDGQGGTELR
jgi:exopolysaccharide biosynthesis protein